MSVGGWGESLVEGDDDHNTFPEADPVELLGYLMKENKIKAVDLASELGVGKSLISDILH